MNIATLAATQEDIRAHRHTGRNNAFPALSFVRDRLRDSVMLFEPCFSAKSSSSKTTPTETSLRQRFDLSKLTTVKPKQSLYSRKYLREERMASLRPFNA